MWLVTYFLITIAHKITEAESVEKHILMILVKTVGSISAQQYSRKLWRPFFKMASISSMKITFLDSFLQTCAISMILVSNHTFLTMRNLNFDLRNSVKAYFTIYETKN